MPAAVVMVASYAAGAAVTGAVGAGIVGAIAGGVAAYATSTILGGALGLTDKPQSQANTQVAQSERGILVNTASTVDPINVIYGSRRWGGGRNLTEVGGSNNEYLYLSITHCEGEISAINTVYLDDVATTDAKFSGLVTIEKHLGVDGQAASSWLISELPGKWTSAHTGDGCAYTILRIKYDANVFSGIPVVTADIDGRLVYDPRDTTWKFSSNPALCILDYLTNTRFGRGVPMSDVDVDSFIAAANTCDITYTDPNGATHSQHTCNGIVNTDTNSLENIRSMLTSCRGTLLYSARGYGLLIDKAETPTTFEFNEDNIVGSWTIGAGSKRTRYNRVRGNWFNPNRSWQPDIWPADSPTFRTTDNGLLLETTIELPFTTNPYEAQIKSERHMRQSRFGKTLSLRATIAGLDCEVGDVVPVTHSTPGYVSKPFRVQRIGLASSDEVDVEMTEYDDGVHSATPLTTPRTTPTTNLPDPYAMPTPVGLALSSGTNDLVVAGDGSIISRIHATWSDPQNIFAKYTEVQFKKSADSIWIQGSSPVAGTLDAYCAPVADGTAYDVRVRHVSVTGAHSAWATYVGYVTVGKTEKPSNVASLTLAGKVLTWPNVTDPDLAGYRIRFQYGANTEWGTASPMHDGLVTASPYTMLVIPPGRVTIMIRAVDTTGNESQASAYVITDLGDSLVANVVESIDYKATAFPGTITNASIVGGNLQSTQTDPFYKADGSDFYGADTAPFYSTNYDGMEWVSTGWTPDLAAVGSNMTIAFALTGDGQAVEYRPTGPNPFYGADLDYFYGDDASVFYDGPGAWQVWPGSIVASNQEFQFRVATSAGPTAGELFAFTVSVDVPDKSVKLSGIAIGSSGTRLTAVVGMFNVIQAVKLTLQGGSTAMKLEIGDYSATLGPLIYARDASNALTTATIDAEPQGY